MLYGRPALTLLVDSSVRIDYFNGVVSKQTDHLDNAVGKQPNLLLHTDRDFDPFETRLGLQVVHP